MARDDVVTRSEVDGVLDLAVRTTKDKLEAANRRPSSEDGVVPAEDVVEKGDEGQTFRSTVEDGAVKATVTVTVASK